MPLNYCTVTIEENELFKIHFDDECGNLRMLRYITLKH